MGIFDLIDKVGKADEELVGQEIIAPVGPGSCRIRTRVAGMVREFQIPRQRTVGIRSFIVKNASHARYIRDLDENEIREYLQVFPKVGLILAYQDEGQWHGFPANADSFTSRCGDPRVVPIQGGEEFVEQFDYAVCRYDGFAFWFEDVDYRTEPEKIDAMRDSLKNRDWGRVRKVDIDRPETYALNVKGLSEEDRIAFQLAARRKIQEMRSTLEDRLEADLHDVGAKLDSYVDRGDRVEVRWVNSSGQGYTSVVERENFRVVTAGICVSGEDRKFNLKSLVGVVNSAESRHRVVRVGHGDMDEEDYFDIHPEPGGLGDRGRRNRW